MRRRGVTAAAVVVAVLIVSPLATAGASDHKPPKTFLGVGDVTQRGRLGSYCWTTGTFPEYVTGCAGGVYWWPEAKRVDARSEAVLFLQKALPPSELSLHAWRDVNRYGYPKGPGKDVAFTLAPATRGGHPGWAASFTLPAKTGHYYLSTFGVWTDEEGTFSDQDADWTFHLRLASAEAPNPTP